MRCWPSSRGAGGPVFAEGEEGFLRDAKVPRAGRFVPLAGGRGTVGRFVRCEVNWSVLLELSCCSASASESSSES